MQGANLTFESAQKASASAKGVSDVLQHLDLMLDIHRESGERCQVTKDQDIQAIVAVLVKQKVFQWQPGRHHRTFRSQTKDPAASLDHAGAPDQLDQGPPEETAHAA